MENGFVLSIAVTLIYTILCFLDMRFLRKDIIEFKVQFRNSLFVFLSTMAGLYLVKNMGSSAGSITDSDSGVSAFTGTPGF
jgi:hypothetical protein